ncbi:phosphopyruvate hydratase [Galbitalea sp. SE-J8]|uniref:phosphopyruvate hydratase n=1 Tax=Galbitalea sp. SE-J8 TaxID=3054952 RepID=UPI00259CA713|nr:phosphopyruvate hydratase [Galbitalea sp. SE-J8]MDM4761999.1 phosphopyruvate hydratase [Galbitalea sp. SE-J8]
MGSMTIESVHAWEALDSRGRPTVACRVRLAGGGVGRAVAPSGASRGAHEAVEVRDGGDRYGGYGVRRAVAAVNDVLGPAVRGRDAGDRAAIDDDLEALDGEPGFARYGGNAALAVSLGVTLAYADGESVELWRTLDPSARPLIPMPMVNILSGGAHAGGAVDLQDFLAVPLGAESFAEAIEWVDRVRAACARLVDAAGGWSALVADEGGLSARLPGNEQALRILGDGIEAAGFVPGDDVGIAIDVAASQLTEHGGVRLRGEGVFLDNAAWVDRVADWVQRYPIVSVEDVLGEDEWPAWRGASQRLDGIQVLGDDLFVTDPERLARGVREGVANSVLVKVNQAGTVTRAERVVRAASAAGYAAVVSARSGDTEDHWLADLATGWRAGQIKVGSTMRSERTAKWNRLLEIESDGDTEFAGRGALAPLTGPVPPVP